jgi:hypothetical protein
VIYPLYHTLHPYRQLLIELIILKSLWLIYFSWVCYFDWQEQIAADATDAKELDVVGPDDGNQGAGHSDHTHGNEAEVAQDPLSLPSGPITRLRAVCFKEALNGLIQENWANSKKTKMGSNNNQGLVHVIKAIEEDN